MDRLGARRLTGVMSEHPILVTGATGKSGRRVVSRLRAEGLPVRAASRNGEHTFDWTDSGTWDAALEGVRSMYIVQLDGTKLVRPFIERAVRHGVQRIVLASRRGIDDPDYAKDSSGVLEGIVDSEAAVRESGLEWTISRPGWFAQNFSEGFFADAVLAGELRLPAGDGAASFVDAEDIAAVVVAALTESRHAGQIYELSGPRAMTLTEVATNSPSPLLTQAVGQPDRVTETGPTGQNPQPPRAVTSLGGCGRRRRNISRWGCCAAHEPPLAAAE
ncbi:NAD(P)H azoreductase [Streptomyces sp. YIM 130001]|uniref:SDR family oxidoreductase n=1 Tax=Streptomyces sp. YIM 130001 TaxID=2259644 RepID=UPI000EE9194E|nr:NAD(P)H-binding protein [Streptomyces sp. YIM 130001]RII11808.1 NAD(P)H azoreductase [Streptomyces sp. YIM 130001]